jgi:hypothetical protein
MSSPVTFTLTSQPVSNRQGVSRPMRCPRCAQNTPDSWQNLQCIDKSRDGESRGDHIKSKDAIEGTFIYRIAWMHCANAECGQTLIRAERHYRFGEGQPANNIESWLVTPQHEMRPVHPLVLDKEPALARDFTEAVAVVPTSPRLSAVLARRIADDLLEKKYAGPN